MARKEMKDVIVVVPGILGSELMKDGKKIWSMSAGGAWNALRTLGNSIKDLELEDDNPDLDDLGDGVTASRLLSDLHLLPGFWTIDGYGKIRDTILKSFVVTPGDNYFEFPYDWRRDNRVAGRKLRIASEEWLSAWRDKSGNGEARLILLCHSMGGLVARDFLERHGGWRDTKSLITFGTPYRGSVNALRTLHKGFKKKLGPITLFDITKMARSLTSMYQLLPIYKCYDPGAGTMVRVGETMGIPGVDAGRAAAALKFHHEIRDLAAAHGDDVEYIEKGYGIHPIIGIDQPTLQSARLDNGKVLFSRQYPGADLGGDGTVPQVSAVPIGWDDKRIGTYSSEKHASLQNSAPMLTQVRGMLTAAKIDLERFEAPPPFSPRLSLDVEDVLDDGDSVLVRVRANLGEPEMRLVVTNADTGAEVAKPDPMKPRDDGWAAFELPPLAEGLYRVVAGSAGGPDTVTTVVAVLGDE